MEGAWMIFLMLEGLTSELKFTMYILSAFHSKKPFDSSLSYVNKFSLLI